MKANNWSKKSFGALENKRLYSRLSSKAWKPQNRKVRPKLHFFFIYNRCLEESIARFIHRWSSPAQFFPNFSLRTWAQTWHVRHFEKIQIKLTHWTNSLHTSCPCESCFLSYFMNVFCFFSLLKWKQKRFLKVKTQMSLTKDLNHNKQIKTTMFALFLGDQEKSLCNRVRVCIWVSLGSDPSHFPTLHPRASNLWKKLHPKDGFC